MRQMNRRRLVFAVFAAVLAVSASFASEAPRAGNDLAIAIGVNASLFSEAPHAGSDASALAAALKDTGSFRRVVHLADRLEDGSAATGRTYPDRKTILSVLKLMAASVAEGDGLFFYFAGPGLVDGEDVGILPAEGENNDPVTLREICGVLGTGKAARCVVALDLHMTGSSDDGDYWLPDEERLAVVVFRQEEDSAQDGEDGARGVFSVGLERAVEGMADADADGSITGGELYDFIHRHVSDYYLENLVLSGALPETNRQSRSLAFLRTAPKASAASDAEAEPEEAVQAAAAEPVVVETASVEASEPQYYRDPSTGRVFVYDEAKGDWVIHSEATYSSSVSSPQYQQSSRTVYAQPRQYSSQPERSGGISPGTAANVLGTVASFLFR